MRILTGLLRRSGRFNGAGMFPSQKCGCDVRTGWYNIASMGPGCFHPRNTIDNTLAWARCGLQWGRDVSIPEMGMTESTQCRLLGLQWGRDVSIPEMYWRGRSGESLEGLQWGRDVSIPEI